MPYEFPYYTLALKYNLLFPALYICYLVYCVFETEYSIGGFKSNEDPSKGKNIHYLDTSNNSHSKCTKLINFCFYGTFLFAFFSSSHTEMMW